MSGSLELPNGRRLDFWWHHQNSRSFVCECGEKRLWTKPAGYEIKSRVRCSCGRLHVRCAAKVYGGVA